MTSRRPLPWCKGPKLGHFLFREAEQPGITFHEHLGMGAHGDVFRVTIDNAVYALKIFLPIDPKRFINRRLVDGNFITYRDVHNHMDPFNCECRAYGRLKETNNENLAARCYGYLLLTEQDEDELEGRGYWHLRRDHIRTPLKAIVKEYIDDPEPFTFKMLGTMRKNIDSLNKIGIVVRGSEERNYRGGLLIDFSVAATVPHIELTWDNPNIEEEDVMQLCNQDREDTDAIINRWNSKNPGCWFWRRFQPMWYFGCRLRNSDRWSTMPYQSEGARYYAMDYDWERPPQANRLVGKRRGSIPPAPVAKKRKKWKRIFGTRKRQRR